MAPIIYRIEVPARCVAPRPSPATNCRPQSLPICSSVSRADQFQSHVKGLRLESLGQPFTPTAAFKASAAITVFIFSRVDMMPVTKSFTVAGGSPGYCLSISDNSSLVLGTPFRQRDEPKPLCVPTPVPRFSPAGVARYRLNSFRSAASVTLRSDSSQVSAFDKAAIRDDLDHPCRSPAPIQLTRVHVAASTSTKAPVLRSATL